VKLSCPSCSAKYSIADEKVQDRLAKIRCRKCSATIIIDGKVDPPSVYTSDGQGGDAPASAAGGDVGPGEFSVDFGDSDQRTMSVDQIVAAYNNGELTAETYVWTEGMGDWTPLGQVPEINAALHAGASAPSPAAAAAEPRASAARSGAGRGSATDLFGSIATAGSEEDVTTSAPQPAAAAAGSALATGARNESSVLFSLSALTAAAAAEPAAPAATSSSVSADAGGDDSGLIDLKALTSASAADQPPAPLIATAPLGMAAPLGGMTAPSPAMDIDIPQQKGGSKTGLMIMGGMLGMGLLIAGAIIATSGNKGDTAAAAASAAAMEAARPAEPVEPAAEPKEEVTAKPPATGTAAVEEPPKEEAAQAPTTTAKTTYRAPAKKTAPSTKSSDDGKVTISEPAPKPKAASASAPAEEAPKKKKSKCNCAPSDLMCAMQCAAGK
jgi:predicted Zn finger-like uncharacterized protein